jgi:general secretion pathway protein G
MTQPERRNDLPEKKKRRCDGFTLIELMVVIVILGLLIGVIGYRLLGRTEEARRTAAALQIRSLTNALQLYKLDSGTYPTTEQGLDALVRQPAAGTAPRNYPKGGYLEGGQVPLDPWGHSYVYLSPAGEGREFEIRSLGADGKEGGEGENTDVTSSNLR